MKTFKNGPQKLLIIGPNLFFSQSSPAHSPQPRIDFSYHNMSGTSICSLICAIHTLHKSLVIQGHIVNCPDTPKQIGYGLDMESLGNNSNCTSYCRKIVFATSKIFERFCTEIPKVKHCHEYSKEDFSQSCCKEVI